MFAILSALVLTLGFALVSPAPGQRAAAQEPPCPHRGLDDCERWEFGQVDRELARAVEEAAAERARRPPGLQRTRQASAHLLAAQREWLRFRDAECRAIVSMNYISARPEEALTSNCLLALTRQRLEQIRSMRKY
jgi:uncharacterized protein YecT (DUF1311 family)